MAMVGAPNAPPAVAGAPERPPDGPRGWSARLRGLIARFVRSPWPFVVLAALGPLLWSQPYGEILFGQDSTRLFRPFSFNVSPFVPYNYLFSSTFPVPDFTPYFYADATLRSFDLLGAPDWLSERLLLAVFAGLAAAGVVVLIRAIDSVHASGSTPGRWIGGLAALVYVYNPFTLSVTFWHIEGWTLFLAFLPWGMALAVRAAFARAIPYRLAAFVALLGIYLAPGVVSSFAVAVGAVTLWGLIAIWLTRGDSPPTGRSRLVRSAVLLGVTVGIEAWSFVPFLLVPNLAYTSNNYVTPANLFSTYYQASATWGTYPVLTLTAFSWLVRTPSAYPWAAWLPTLAVVAVVFPLLAVLGARRLRSSPGSLLVYAIGLSLLPLMIGNVPPLSNANLALLHVGGPFLVLVAAYYVLAPAYVLVVVAGLRETFRRTEPATPPRAPVVAPTGREERVRRWRRTLGSPTGVATVGIAMLLLLSAAPFVTGTVYQRSGPNADIVAVPAAFPELGRYFGTPATGPDFYVLALPMSAQNGVYVDIDGRQFLDTSSLLASYLPYPLLQTNNGPTAAAVEEMLALGPPRNLSAVLANLHVRYVVVDPFVNQTPPTMNEAPSGRAIDYPTVLGALPTALGPATSVGSFEVYDVPGAIPLAWSTNELVGIDSPDPASALSLIGAVRAGPPGWTSALEGALWSPNGTLPGWELTPRPVTGASSTLDVPAGSTPTSIDSAGRWAPTPCVVGTCQVNGTTFQWSGATVTARGPVERSTTVAGDYRTNLPLSSGGYCASGGSPVELVANGTVTGPAFLAANITLSDPAVNNWATLNVSDGPLALTLQAYQGGSTGPADIGLSASYRAQVFAWRNVYLPTVLPNGTAWSLQLDWNGTSAWGSVVAGSNDTSTTLAFGDLEEDGTNPGFNAASAPPGAVNLSRGTESVTLQGGSFCLVSASVEQAPDVQLLVAASAGAPTEATPGVGSSVTSDGDFRLPASDRYAILGYPSNPLWTASVGGAAMVTVVAGAPFANVVAVSAGGTTVTFHFRTSILLGLELSWFEVGGLVALLVALTWVRRRRARRAALGLPTSTPGTPPPAPPPARLP
ncbi:MAG TPA: hypothetical protein VN864_08175 [Thermoplasmata archaeon]|nr:hypothetical protein [Thermoplasmata archaeon]